MEEDNRFDVINTATTQELLNGTKKFISESDLLLTFPEGIVQFKYTEKVDNDKLDVKPGVNSLVSMGGELELRPIDLRAENLLESITNTSNIIREAEQFFGNLKIYDDLGVQKKRAVLLWGPPGTGKTSSLSKVSAQLCKEDPGTTVIIWNTSQVKPESVYNLLNFKANYDTAITRMILVMEDIGGGESSYSHHKEVTSGLLNLLDGVDITFKYPTFMIATTNAPHNLLEALADRPGRFDKMVEMGHPNDQERVNLVEFIARRPLTVDETDYIKSKTSDFSIAHLKEIVLRSLLTNQTIMAVIDEIGAHKKLVKDEYQKRRSMGING
jgi:cell division protease FtsH